MPDTDVSFMLTYKPPFGLSGALIRLDWKPFHHHANRGLIKGEWSFRRINQTHFHPFWENFERGLPIMLRENLPIALPVERALENFRDMLNYAGELMRISDIQKIGPPRWEPRFL